MGRELRRVRTAEHWFWMDSTRWEIGRLPWAGESGALLVASPDKAVKDRSEVLEGPGLLGS